jgi:RNA polymerase sigma-70 factor, ECF subfamily
MKNAHQNRCDTFVRLLAACEQRLDAFVLALVPNWSDAQDIIQETKLRLWEQFNTYDPQKDFGTWACVIARYQVLTFHKRFARSRVQFSPALIERLSEDFEETDAETPTRLTLLQQCMNKLDEWQRTMLLRCYATDHSYSQEVASQFGRKPGAIRQALLRIRRKLYECVESAQQTEAKKP